MEIADRVFSVDIDSNATSLTQKLAGSKGNLNTAIMDGVEFLLTHEQSIDLLYLDGPDPNEAGRQWHLNAYLAAKSNLHSKSLILIDDTHENGKGHLLIPRCVRDRWRVVVDGYMTLLVRNNSP